MGGEGKNQEDLKMAILKRWDSVVWGCVGVAIWGCILWLAIPARPERIEVDVIGNLQDESAYLRDQNAVLAAEIRRLDPDNQSLD